MRNPIPLTYRDDYQSFNIIEEFAALEGRNKMLLCDHLFIEGRHTFTRTVQLLWEKAQTQDIKKLENFLHLLRKTAH